MISTTERIKTNWLLLDDLDMWDEFIIKKNDEKHVKYYYSELEDFIDKQLQAGVNWLDSPEAKRFFYNEAEYSQEVFESLENEWDKIINGKYKTIDELLDEFYNTGKQKGYSDIKQHIRFTDADRLALTFAKIYNFGLIRKLSNDLRNNVKNKIIKSAIGGENPNKLANELLKLGIKPLPNMTLSAKQRAVMIAKTETSRIQNTGILQSYVNEGYTEVTILTSEDDHVCYTCLRIAYEFNKDDEVVYSNNAGERTHNIRKLLKSGNYPPFHPNCRCTVLPVWKTKGEPPENPYVVDLTPSFMESNFPSLFPSDNTPLEELDNDLIKTNITEFSEHIEAIRDVDENVEYFEAFDGKGNRVLYRRGKEHEIGLSVEDFEEIKQKGGVIVIHNHPSKFNSLHSYKDIITQLEQGYEISIVESYTKRYIIVNKNNLSPNDKQALINAIDDFGHAYEYKIKMLIKERLKSKLPDKEITEKEYLELEYECAEEVVEETTFEYEHAIYNIFNESTGLQLFVHDRDFEWWDVND